MVIGNDLCEKVLTREAGNLISPDADDVRGHILMAVAGAVAIGYAIGYGIQTARETPSSGSKPLNEPIQQTVDRAKQAANPPMK